MSASDAAPVVHQHSFAQSLNCKTNLPIMMLVDHFENECNDAKHEYEYDHCLKCPSGANTFKQQIKDQLNRKLFGGDYSNKFKQQSAKSLYLRLLKLFIIWSNFEIMYEERKKRLSKYKKTP